MSDKELYPLFLENVRKKNVWGRGTGSWDEAPDSSVDRQTGDMEFES